MIPFEKGLIISVHKDSYVVLIEKRELNAELSGKLRFNTASEEDFPTVGDTVDLQIVDEQFAIIHDISPRKTLLCRQAVGQKGRKQLIAANIDTAFIVQSAETDFSINRLDRYLDVVYSGGAKGCLILNKCDLLSKDDLDQKIEAVRSRYPDLKIILTSCLTENGLNAVKDAIEPGQLYCFMGSSGVGKSTLLNKIAPELSLATGSVSDVNHKGKHTTTARSVHALQNGAWVVDTPGMRELGVTEDEGSLVDVFPEIVMLSYQCRFPNCTHNVEPGCAVLEAIRKGDLSEKTFQNYEKMRREKAHFASTLVDRRQKEKQFGKMYKQVKKGNPKNRALE